jgi:hypothetical protein
MALAVVPQVAPNWLSYALLRFEVNIRASAILGFVGAGGIGYDLRNAMTVRAGALRRGGGDLPAPVRNHRGRGPDQRTDAPQARKGCGAVTSLADPPPLEGVLRAMRRRRLVALAVPAFLLLYLVYVFVAYDVPGPRAAGAARQRGDLGVGQLELPDPCHPRQPTGESRSPSTEPRATYAPDAGRLGRRRPGARVDLPGPFVTFAADGRSSYAQPDEPPLTIRVWTGR